MASEDSDDESVSSVEAPQGSTSPDLEVLAAALSPKLVPAPSGAFNFSEKPRLRFFLRFIGSSFR